MSAKIGKNRLFAGRAIIAGFEGKDLPFSLCELLSKGMLGGLVLFKRNIEDHIHATNLISKARSLSTAQRMPLFCVDQEGGRVVRLRDPLTVLPPAELFGNIDDIDFTKGAGQLVGRELRSLGFSMNFAPVMDVNTNQTSPVIGDRSFGNNPDIVRRHGLAFAQGLSKSGVTPCAKHFPGHGDAALDSHLSLPRVNLELNRLEQTEMLPFEAWIKADLGPVMTAHVIYPSLDSINPATCSRSIIQGQLRERLGFQGAVLSDDLEMGAILEIGGPSIAAVKAIRAQVDGLLVCRSENTLNDVIEALTHEAEKDQAFANRLESAADRIGSIPRSAPDNIDVKWLGSKEHQEQKSKILARIEKEAF